MDGPFNRHGGLTLVPMLGFEDLAERVAAKVRVIGEEEEED